MVRKPKLTLAEREQIFGWLHEAKSLREIARILNRDHSSIVREVNRNRNQNTGEYLPCVAQEKAEKREKSQREKAPLKEPEIFLYVRRKLRMGWSPEVIAGCLPLDLPGNRIDDETIYRYIYNSRKHPKECLFTHLRLHRKRRMRKHGRKVKSSRIPGRIGIEDRPAAVALREEFGHGETDLMEGIRSDKPVVHVTVERKTKYVQLAVPTYFTTPYHSWEKGTIENTIGRLRKYIPKKISIAQLTPEELRYIQYEMNNTPRKCLQFQTPAQALAKERNNTIF